MESLIENVVLMLQNEPMLDDQLAERIRQARAWKIDSHIYRRKRDPFVPRPVGKYNNH